METSPYLTLHEAAAYLRYQTVAGFRQAVRRLRIPHLVRGRERLFLPSDLQRVWTRPQRSRKPRTDEADEGVSRG